MSKPTPDDDDRLNPKVAASCFDFLLIELVPMTYRVVTELHAREQALLAQQGQSSSLFTGGGKTTAAARDRTSAVSSSGESGGAAHNGAHTATEEGPEGEADEDETSEAVFHRLDALGYRVGQGLIERFSENQPRPNTPLDSIKFVCKDLWTRVFRKQIDNLKTNHRGTFVLTDNRFQPLHRMSVDRRLGPRGTDEALRRAQAFLWFPCGIIRGALSGLGLNVTVHAETSDLPIATFQIRTIGAAP